MNPTITAQQYRRMSGSEHKSLYCTKCATRNPTIWCWDMEEPYSNCCHAPLVIGYPRYHLEVKS